MAQLVLRSVSTAMKVTGFSFAVVASISPLNLFAYSNVAMPSYTSGSAPQHHNFPAVSTAQVRSPPAASDTNLHASPGPHWIGSGTVLQSEGQKATPDGHAEGVLRSCP